MTIIKYFLFCLFYTQILIAQSIVIGTGASIEVGTDADVCAGEVGNITGNIFGAGTQCGTSPVPVELSSFAASTQNYKVQLNWTTQTEVSNYGFEIERAIINSKFEIKNSKFEQIGFIEGHGNSNSPKQYSFIDEKPFGGSKFQYRLKQIDTDGKFDYSDIVEVEIIPDKFELYQNYPNPFNPKTIIRFQVPEESKVVLKVYDILGAELMELINDKKIAGIYELELNSTSLPSGTYIYRIIADDFTDTKKMLLLK